MGDSFEKRQRERRKQQKRREKAARKQDPDRPPGTTGPTFIELDEFLKDTPDLGPEEEPAEKPEGGGEQPRSGG